VDDLLLTIAPFLVAGGGPTLVDGEGLDPSVRLAVGAVTRAGEHLFVHYEVVR